jgi:hypothetical protein
MNTSNFIEQPKKEKDIARRRGVNEEEAGSGNSSTDRSTMRLDQIIKFIYRLD